MQSMTWKGDSIATPSSANADIQGSKRGRTDEDGEHAQVLEIAEVTRDQVVDLPYEVLVAALLVRLRGFRLFLRRGLTLRGGLALPFDGTGRARGHGRARARSRRVLRRTLGAVLIALIGADLRRAVGGRDGRAGSTRRRRRRVGRFRLHAYAQGMLEDELSDDCLDAHAQTRLSVSLVSYGDEMRAQRHTWWYMNH